MAIGITGNLDKSQKKKIFAINILIEVITIDVTTKTKKMNITNLAHKKGGSFQKFNSNELSSYDNKFSFS